MQQWLIYLNSVFLILCHTICVLCMYVCMYVCMVCHCLIQRYSSYHGYQFNFVCLVKTTIMWSCIFYNFPVTAICTIRPRVSLSFMHLQGSLFYCCYYTEATERRPMDGEDCSAPGWTPSDKCFNDYTLLWPKSASPKRVLLKEGCSMIATNMCKNRIARRIQGNIGKWRSVTAW
jgi:hypothetical protein